MELNSSSQIRTKYSPLLMTYKWKRVQSLSHSGGVVAALSPAHVYKSDATCVISNCNEEAGIRRIAWEIYMINFPTADIELNGFFATVFNALIKCLCPSLIAPCLW